MHLITQRGEVNGPPIGFKCTLHKVPNPKFPAKKYKHWGRTGAAKVARDLAVGEQGAVTYSYHLS